MDYDIQAQYYGIKKVIIMPQVDKLYIVCDNLAVQPVELIGDGVTYDRDFITIGEVRLFFFLIFFSR